MTVARLAVVRLVLLPLHSHWWAGQTSYSLYSALLLLYVLQIVNMLIYFNWPAHHIENHDTEVIWVVQERKIEVSLLLVTGYHTLFIFNSLLIHENFILVIYPSFPAGFLCVTKINIKFCCNSSLSRFIYPTINSVSPVMAFYQMFYGTLSFHR